jgi:hypothetical protein
MDAERIAATTIDGALERPVFEVADRGYRWRDVVDAARARGDWQRIEQRAREGMACARQADASGDRLGRREVEDAADRWRYARNLLAADETEQWLARWGLEVEDWLEYVRRSLLRDRWSTRLPSIAAGRPVSDEDVQTAVWAEAVCSGELERLAETLAELIAVHARVSGDAPAAGAAAEIEASQDSLRAEVLTGEAVERELARHHLEWTRVDCCCLLVPDEGVAREAAMCVREDARDLRDVASDAGLAVQGRSFHLDGSEPIIGDHLLGARPGDLVGPLALDEGFLVCLVLDRVPPSMAAPLVRRRAEARVVRAAVEKEVASRVRWRERLSPVLEGVDA